jgi:hypothetical protein
MDLTPSTKSAARFTITRSISVAYGTCVGEAIGQSNVLPVRR